MDKIKWHTEKRKVKDLIPYGSNPRQITKDQLHQLKESMARFDYCEMVAIQPDNTIIAGHMRVKAMKELKWSNKEIEVRVPNRTLSMEEMREYLIRSNRNTGDWDWDILANEFEMNDLIEWGFNAEDFQFDVEEIENEDPSEENFSPPSDPKTKLGDLFQLGDHYLICGDSTHPETVSKLLKENVPILMVTDPPYGVEYTPEWRNELKGKKSRSRAVGKVQNDDQINWSLAWYLFPGSVAYIWHSSRFSSKVQESLNEADFEIISQIIWVKQHFAISRGDYHWQHEPCWYSVKKGNSHNWQGSRKESTVWNIKNLNAFGKSTEDERTPHSTQKPLECMSIPIKNNSAEGEGVYDPFLGSGTTLLACEKLKRICYGIELDPAYCDIIIHRWINYRKKLGKDFCVLRNGKKCNGEFVKE